MTKPTKPKAARKPTKAELDKRMLFPIEMQDAMPRVLQENAATLFPNTPIEVVYEQRSFAVYCEGQWSSNEDSITNVVNRIRELIKSNRESWESRATYTNPSWPGWSKVKMGVLYELIGVGHAGGANKAS